MSSSPKPKSFIRRLGQIELCESALHNLDYYCSTALTCRYTLPPSLRGFDNQDRVFRRFDQAIAQTVLRFPLLQVGLVGESTKKPAWVSLPSLDLADHVSWDVRPESKEYERAFEANLGYQLDSKFESIETRPGWRICLMRTKTDNFVDVMYVWNHANHDGMGAKIFQKTLLQSLNYPTSSSLLRSGSRAITTSICKDSFPQPQEKLAKHNLSLGYACSEIWHGLCPSCFHSAESKARWAPIQADPYITRFKAVDIDAITLKKLLGQCRENDTTLTGLIHGIVLACLSVDINEGNTDAFQVATAIDHRKFLRKELRPSKYASIDLDNSIQNCTASLSHLFDHEIVSDMRAQARINNWPAQPIGDLEPTIWKAAQQIRRDIEKRLDAGVNDNVVGLMKVVSDWHDYLESLGKRPRDLSWEVTNLGVIDGKTEDDGFAMGRARFSLSGNVVGPAIQISMVSVKDGDLSVELSWQGLPEIHEVAQRLVQDMRAWLLYLGA
ncbi:uncharacterized protein FFB20_11387 [Fusarium fujikuroi]|uniref:Alcohol acetyltransferase FCK4 n=2 Tax=Fusarium fujikuroi TaxID=5127 RepID=S0DV37_GIBF5|nr:uncharacterized protein FFUJ_02190 [Fusarium fujikuroi IMI 58289]KLO99446.1 uncharacterized protein Y057_4893 [Fusarium fujikuroi]KLP19656.1 uncharacterized protein LW94_3316 [Fusarium fujikuroi]QGI61422.1 hypothetical protein CEK27_005393 [Fusarium fujikuroi]QGI78603.1 hypothetical protein CEK25_005332 [Fusarium fujikuroi]QGI92320.1 hypothetical protein CEK26_005389 [Fusarium fujikuroi]